MKRYYAISMVVHIMAAIIFSNVPMLLRPLNPDDFMLGGVSAPVVTSRPVVLAPSRGGGSTPNKPPRRRAAKPRPPSVHEPTLPSAEGPRSIDLFPKTLGGMGGSPPIYGDVGHPTGAEEGVLATRKYDGYFRRVEQMVQPFWQPIIVVRAVDPYGTQLMFKDRRTVLGVELSADGTVVRVWVMQPSGFEELDAEGVHAIWSAVQFPNPPRGLVVDNRILFRFVFTVTGMRAWLKVSD